MTTNASHRWHRVPALRRPPAGPRLPRLALLALTGVALAEAGRMALRIRAARALVHTSVPFQAAPPNPPIRLLIVGDSTGEGTGATAPQRSVAGLIAQAHPDWQIVNRAAVGARFADVERQLAGEPAGVRYDTVIVMAGGNDVLRLTGRQALHDAVARTLRRARRLSRRVVVMPAGNVGNAPFFRGPLAWWMTHRARRLHAVVRDVVAGAGDGVVYVDLFRERAADPFAQQPARMNAADGLHPSDAGYRVWFETLRQRVGL